jgi:formylglycine-generating enzyme required for sulfatase activity
MEMVLIPGACYEVPEEPGAVAEGKKGLCLSPFYLGVHEVTFDAYDRFARETGRDLPDDEGWGRGTRPVINVSLYGPRPCGTPSAMSPMGSFGRSRTGCRAAGSRW